MFHDIPEAMLARLRHLESREADAPGGVCRIASETGRLLAILAAAAPAGQFVAIGAGAGYAALWLSLACRSRGEMLVTVDADPGRILETEETLRLACADDVVRLVCDEPLKLVDGMHGIAFAYVDADRDVFLQALALLAPRMVPGGLLAANSVLGHARELPGLVEQIRADARLDALVVPGGEGGLLLARRSSQGRPRTVTYS